MKFRAVLLAVTAIVLLILTPSSPAAMIFNDRAAFEAALPAGVQPEAVVSADLEVLEVQNIDSIIITDAIRVNPGNVGVPIYSVEHISEPLIAFSMIISTPPGAREIIVSDGTVVDHSGSFLGIIADSGMTFDSFTSTVSNPATLSGFEAAFTIIPEPASAAMLAPLALFARRRGTA